MKVTVQSRETIKPSSPTPEQHRCVQLSFLDQINTRYFASYIYYYPLIMSSTDDEDDMMMKMKIKASNVERSEHLKKSLSEILTTYYPLAGRVTDVYIDCNDEGVEYSEARVLECQLSQLLAQPNKYDLNKLLPRDDQQQLCDSGDTPLAIQVNFFDCGGIAIGMCFTHKIMDGMSFFTFVNYWAAQARARARAQAGQVTTLLELELQSVQARAQAADTTKAKDENVSFPPPPPSLWFDQVVTLFPPRDLSSYATILARTGITKEKLVAKSFVFTNSALAALKAKYSTSCITPTRVEALSTFIWSRFAASTSQKNTQSERTLYIVVQAVNLRPRANPPLPDTCFGNLSRFVMIAAQYSKEELGEGDLVVTHMREAIQKIDSGYVKRLQEGDLQQTIHRVDEVVDKLKRKSSERSLESTVSIAFSSMWRFPLYEADFGWGKPRWVGMAARPLKNTVVFLPTRSGDGIEAWIHMNEDDMTQLEVDKHFLNYIEYVNQLE